MKTTASRVALLVALLSGFTANASATELLLNGGFEDAFSPGLGLPADFAFWTETSIDGLYPRMGVPHSGSYAVSFGGPEVDSVSQTFLTEAGQSYVIDFWLADRLVNDCPGGLFSNCEGQSFRAYWNDTPMLQIGGLLLGFPYTEYTFVMSATGPTSSVRFSGGNIPGFFYVDDVSVTPVPEPASIALIATGLATVFARRRVRRTRHLMQRATP